MSNSQQQQDPRTGKPEARPYKASSRPYGGPLRFVETLEGEGVLTWTGGETPVTYHLDLFDGRMGLAGSGTVDGDLPEALDGQARLRLSETKDVEVALFENEGGQAVVETRGAIREKTPKVRRAAKT